MGEKILLDTDISSDIDDSICLAYLLSQPKCELLGIRTVSGESDKRAMMTSEMCKVAGKGGIPIYAGAEMYAAAAIGKADGCFVKMGTRKKLPKRGSYRVYAPNYKKKS